MKKILSLLGTITLMGTSTTSLIACDVSQKYTQEKLSQLKAQNNINTKDGILEWIAPQEKPFNNVDDKSYYVVWRGDKNDDWNITKFKNNKNKDNLIKIITISNWNLCLNKDIPHNIKNDIDIILFVVENEKQNTIKQKSYIWENKNNHYFKAVYRWNGQEQKLPSLIIDNDNIKVNE